MELLFKGVSADFNIFFISWTNTEAFTLTSV